MSDSKGLLVGMIRQAEAAGGVTMTISGQVEDGWGFRIQVVRPDLWKKIERREEDFDADAEAERQEEV